MIHTDLEEFVCKLVFLCILVRFIHKILLIQFVFDLRWSNGHAHLRKSGTDSSFFVHCYVPQ